MDFRETDEQRMLREAVHGIASKYGHEYFTERARAGGRADELWNELAAGGFLGVNVPEEYGGGGMGIAELAIVLEELAANGCPLLLLVVSPAICATIIARFGSDSQKQNWLPRFGSGELKMAFAITEPDAGSNSHNIATTAHPRRRRLPPVGDQVLHLGGRRVRGRAGGDAHRRGRGHRARPGCLCSWWTSTAPASTARSSPSRSWHPRSSSPCSSTT